ncbi:hypothetical protein ACQPZ8_32730 [Actinomadura nitritigenes]|uniref:hypothetical protein n=1 Tax=Actinomadura nitritigenes TaxID=134602 RepID=UPI003D8B9BB7
MTITFSSVSKGPAIEVIDRGLGLHPMERAELNRRLTGTAEFDLADTERLGLFVVARLAGRHEIKVELQPSPYGGTTAAVLIPGTLVTAGGSEARAAALEKPAKPPRTGGAAPRSAVSTSGAGRRRSHRQVARGVPRVRVPRPPGVAPTSTAAIIV